MAKGGVNRDPNNLAKGKAGVMPASEATFDDEGLFHTLQSIFANSAAASEYAMISVGHTKVKSNG